MLTRFQDVVERLGSRHLAKRPAALVEESARIGLVSIRDNLSHQSLSHPTRKLVPGTIIIVHVQLPSAPTHCALPPSPTPTSLLLPDYVAASTGVP